MNASNFPRKVMLALITGVMIKLGKCVRM